MKKAPHLSTRFVVSALGLMLANAAWAADFTADNLFSTINTTVGTGSSGGKLTVNGQSGNSALPAFSLTGDGGVIFTGTLGTGTLPTASAALPKLVWYPKKAALMGGVYLPTSDADIGDYSIAFGYGSMASGTGSVAMGSGATATGAASVAFGQGIANGAESFAVGPLATATADGSVVLGQNSEVTSDFGISLGGYNSVTNGAFAAIGRYAHASGWASISLGIETSASGNNSVAMGTSSSANGDNSMTFGANSSANGNYSMTLGTGNVAESYESIALGSYSISEGGDPASWVATDPLLIIGNGSDYLSPHTGLLMLKNGKINLYGSSATTPQIVIDPDGSSITVGGRAVLTANANNNVIVTDGGGFGIDNNNKIQFGTGNNVNILSAGASALFVNGSSGNVGLGTTSPNSKLNVSGVLSVFGSTQNSVGHAVAGDVVLPYGGALRFANNVNNSSVGLVSLGSYGGVGNSLLIGNNDSNSTWPASIQFNTSSYPNVPTERMRIDTNGNVGIGTTGPKFGVDVYNGHMVFKNATSQTDQGGDAKNMGIGWASSAQTNVISNLLTVDRNGNYGGDFKFYSRSPGGGTMPAALATLTAYGDLGIGIPAPTRRLDVIGTSGVRIGFRDNSYPSAPTTIATSSYLQLGGAEWNDNSYRLITFGYNYSPGYEIAPAYMGYQEVTHSGATYGDLVFGTRSVTTNTAPTERMRITSGGLINFYPGSAPTTAKIIIDPNIPQITIDGAQVLTSTSTLTTAQSFTAPSYSFKSGTTDRLTINSTGNVGIGTASPARQLDIVGNSGARISLGGSSAPTVVENSSYLHLGGQEIGSLSYRLITFGYSDPSHTIPPAYMGYQEISNVDSTYGALVFGTRGSTTNVPPAERMRITSFGSVGIGTKDPYTVSKLHVETDSNQFNVLARRGSATAGDTAAIGLGVTNNTVGTAIKGGIFFQRTGSNGVGDLYFANNSVAADTNVTTADTRMVIASSGNVGIGIPYFTAPLAKLAVSGNATLGTNLTGAVADQVIVGKNNNAASGHTDGVFIVGAGSGTSPSTRANAVRVLADGTMLVKRSGDIGMGDFVDGPQP